MESQLNHYREKERLDLRRQILMKNEARKTGSSGFSFRLLIIISLSFIVRLNMFDANV